VPEDALVLVLLNSMLYGWALIWPISRWGFRLKEKRYNVLGWIFAVALVLMAASHVYIWDLYASGNRDAFMAWAIPQFVGLGAWVASVVALIMLWANNRASAT